MKDIHIGKIIKEEVKRQGRSVKWLSEKLYCDRSNIYDIFKRQSIDTSLLKRFSEILGIDFFEYYRN
ncbi:MAG: XRE family transcriptional regulator [Bacteroidales bacterium]|nr:XRE family transcriptional regulator [Bacteroidales bacterium]